MNRGLYFAPLMLIIAGCSPQDSRICLNALAKPRYISECVHRQAYLFAKADGSVRDIATAVVESCSGFIFHKIIRKPADFDVESYTKLLEDNAMKDAIRRVVEARAGKCDAPSGGVPMTASWIEDVPEDVKNAKR